MPGAVAVLDRLGVRPRGMPFQGISYLRAYGGSGARHSFSTGPDSGRAGRSCTGRWRTALGRRVWRSSRTGSSRWCRTARGSGWSCRAVPSSRRRGPWPVTVCTPRREACSVSRCAATDAGSGCVARVGAAEWASPVRGAGPLRQRVARRVAGRVLLVGDAAGYVDALTGEGLRVGLESAGAALDAIEAGRPAVCERRWADISRSYRYVTATLVAATSAAPLRRAVVPASRALPGVFAHAVEALGGGVAESRRGRGG